MSTIKESSDELNPATATTESVTPATKKGSAVDLLALALATFGVGYMPIAPGTWGSLVGVAIYLLLRMSAGAFEASERIFLTLELTLILIVTVVGIWAASRAERRVRKKDPGIVVIDEVAGQLISLLPIGLALTPSWWIWVMVAFFLFRASDIVKPFPARKFESLPGGTGIMADDLVAGAYAAVAVAIGMWIGTLL